MELHTLGERIRYLRKQNQLNQKQLGEKVDVKRSAVYLWEKNSVTPSYKNLHKLASVFDVDAAWLKTGVKAHPNQLLQTFGQRLKALRIQRNLYQQDIAEALGVTKASISQWESDDNKPSGESLYKLCEVLHTDARYLQTGMKTAKYNILDDLSNDAVEIIKLVSEIDKNDRQKLRAMRTLLGIS